MFVLAYAFLTTYQAYYLLDKLGSAEADVPRQIFLGTLAQSVVVVAASLIGGRLSDRTGRRRPGRPARPAGEGARRRPAAGLGHAGRTDN
jgi:MFS family permease